MKQNSLASEAIQLTLPDAVQTSPGPLEGFTTWHKVSNFSRNRSSPASLTAFTEHLHRSPTANRVSVVPTVGLLPVSSAGVNPSQWKQAAERCEAPLVSSLCVSTAHGAIVMAASLFGKRRKQVASVSLSPPFFSFPLPPPSTESTAQMFL